MSIILKLTKQCVSNIRSRIYQKFLGKKGNGLMFDEFVRNLLHLHTRTSSQPFEAQCE